MKKLLRRLDKEDEPFPKRLRLALAAFESHNLLVQRKEELILNWLCERGENSNSEDIWSVLEACLNSNQMKMSGTTIRPSVKSSISQVLTRLLHDDGTVGSKIKLLNCAISLIEHANFQQHFKQQLVQYFELLTYIIECAIKERSSECCIRILQNIYLLNKQVSNKEEFSILFISKLMHIVKIQTCFEEKDEFVSRIRAEVFKCIQQVLFPKSRFKEISLALKSLFNGDNDNQSHLLGLLFEFLSSIVKDNEFSHDMYSVTFHAFVTSYKTDPVSVYRMFIVMCHFIGFNPEIVLLPDNELKCLLRHKKFKKTFPDNDIRKPGSVNGKSMSITRMLLMNLSEANVELNDNNELPFHGWLQALISEVFSVWSSINDEKILASLLEVLCAFIKLDPLIIESKIGEILETVMISKKMSQELKLAYSVFLHDVLEMCVKLSRLQKLVTKLLALGKIIEEKSAEELAELPEVFTSEFSTEFRTAIAFLPGWETIRIMRTLLYHFKEDCVLPLENLQGNYPVLFLQMTSELLCQFLRGTRVAEHSVPEQVVSKFTDAMIELQSLLGKLGQAILQREHSCALMRPFMQLSYNWGEMKLLLLHYGVKTESTSLKCQLAALQNDLILKMTEYNVESMEKMVLQKLRTVVLFVDEGKLKKDVTTAIARHVAFHIKDSMSFIFTENNSSLTLPYLKPEHLELIANHFLLEFVHNNEVPKAMPTNWYKMAAIMNRYCKNDGIEEVWKAECASLVPERKLIVALTCSTLCGVVKIFTRTKRRHDSPKHKVSPPTLVRDVLSKINSTFVLKCFLEDDMDSMSPLVTEMSNIINAHLQKERTFNAINGNKLDLTALHRHLQLLKNLPLQYAPSVIKTLVVLSMLAIAITLEEFSAWKKEELSSTIQELLYKDLLIGVLDSPDPPNCSSYMDMGLLTHWLSRVDMCLPRDLHSLLFQQLFLSSLSSSSSLIHLQTSFPMFRKHGDFESEDLEPAVAFLQVLNKLAYIIWLTLCTKSAESYYIGLHYVLNQLNLTIHLSKQQNLEDKSLCEKYQRRLSQGLVKMLEQLKDTTPTPTASDGFNLILTYCLMKGDHKHLDTLTVHLSKMVESSKKIFKSSEDFEDLKAKMSIWKAIVLSQFNDKKVNSRKVALEHLGQHMTLFLQEREFVETGRTLIPVVEVLITIAQNTMLYFSSEMLDLCFNCIVTAFVREPSDIFNSCSVLLRLLQTLMQNREALVLDRIPSLLQCYRLLADALANHGQVKQQCSPAQVQECAACVHRLERLTNTFKNNKPHFARLAPYLVADFLHIFETYTLYPEIKLHYTNSIHFLLDICDRHALSFLSRNLTSASQQLLKTFHTSYLKYHRFTGKV
ncbi:hypothetical protein C0J52_09174 [Blattella germanica]|nr:hypothetical protein C0J52_09174 [Blattella germanica]